MSEKIVHVSLRVPETLHRQLSEWADREHRSLHGQIIHTLELNVQREHRRPLRSYFEVWKKIFGGTDVQLASSLGISQETLAELTSRAVKTERPVNSRIDSGDATPDAVEVSLLESEFGIAEDALFDVIFEAMLGRRRDRISDDQAD